MTVLLGLFLIDLVLPPRRVATTVIENEFTKWRHKTYTSNVTLVTDHGSILVSNRHLMDYTTNHRFVSNPKSATLYKSRLIGINLSIVITELNHQKLETTKSAYGALIFLPILILILSSLVALTKNQWIIMNMGSFSLALLIFYSILLFSKCGRIGWNELK